MIWSDIKLHITLPATRWDATKTHPLRASCSSFENHWALQLQARPIQNWDLSHSRQAESTPWTDPCLSSLSVAADPMSSVEWKVVLSMEDFFWQENHHDSGRSEWVDFICLLSFSNVLIFLANINRTIRESEHSFIIAYHWVTEIYHQHIHFKTKYPVVCLYFTSRCL